MGVRVVGHRDQFCRRREGPRLGFLAYYATDQSLTSKRGVSLGPVNEAFHRVREMAIFTTRGRRPGAAKVTFSRVARSGTNWLGVPHPAIMHQVSARCPSAGARASRRVSASGMNLGVEGRGGGRIEATKG
ncbi:hypothetical protein CRG98_000750 [Punica granatum]|uniref:Uncharacterized protein n=1 Tax=Punica granatum TaxID=22663 RepID=A0A2I0LDZ4_PUNGR|nr:hypothetical protein CRG98_000750 [Punica granatum]